MFLPRLELREQIVQRIVLLQLAQILGIGRRNVDRDIAGVVVDLLQADQIIVGCIFDRGRGVLADIDPENAPFFWELSRPNVLQQTINPAVVETHTVDDALRFRNAEQARPGIAILRPWCDRADFEKTEAQAGQAVNVVAVLVQPGGEANRVGECQPHNLNRAGLYRFNDQAGQTAGIE